MRLVSILRAGHRQLPSRIVVAWAVLGAAAGTCLMYSKAVYDDSEHDAGPIPVDVDVSYLSGHGPPVEQWVRMGGELVYHDPRGQLDDFAEAVNRWRRRAWVSLGSLGAMFGLVFCQLCRKLGTPTARRDVRLWLLASLAVFGLIAWAGRPGEGESLLRATRVFVFYSENMGRLWLLHELTALLKNTLRDGLAAGVVGWAVHVVLASWGVRVPGRSAPDQAADYDDRARPSLPISE